MKKIKIIFYLILSVAVFDQTLAMEQNLITSPLPSFHKGCKLTTTYIQKNKTYKITADLDTINQKFLYTCYRLLECRSPCYYIATIPDLFYHYQLIIYKSYIEYYHDNYNNGHIKMYLDMYGDEKKFGLEKKLIEIAKKGLEKNEKMKKIFINDLFNNLYLYEEYFNKDYNLEKTDKESTTVLSNIAHTTIRDGENNNKNASLHTYYSMTPYKYTQYYLKKKKLD